MDGTIRRLARADVVQRSGTAERDHFHGWANARIGQFAAKIADLRDGHRHGVVYPKQRMFTGKRVEQRYAPASAYLEVLQPDGGRRLDSVGHHQRRRRSIGTEAYAGSLDTA